MPPFSARKRVVITGLGIVSPIGIGKDDFFNSSIAGRNGIGPITAFDVSRYPAKLAGEVHGFDPTLYMDRKKARRLGRATQFAIAAARQALTDSHFKISKDNENRIGLSVGVGANQLDITELAYDTLKRRGVNRLPVFSVEAAFPNASAGQIALELNIQGPMVTFSTACAAGGNAIGYAISEIQHDGTDAMLAGGAEATITPLGLAAFCSGRLLSTNRDPEIACRPFDLKRDGLVMAEGAAFVVLESLEHAMSRGAKVYAEIIGYASVSGAIDMTHPDTTGGSFRRSMLRALKEADMTIDHVSYINAHGVSAPITDLCEARAIHDILGDRVQQVPVTSIKSMIGQPFAAGCPMQIVSSVLTLEHRIIPPTIHYSEPDPNIRLNVVANSALGKENLDSVLVNAFGYGGTNVSVILKQVYGHKDRRLSYHPLTHSDRRGNHSRRKNLRRGTHP